MPRKVDPKSDWQPKDLSACETVYKMTAEERLCIWGSIDQARISDPNGLMESVEDLIKLYLVLRSNSDSRPKPRQKLAALEPVARGAGSLISAFDGLDIETRSELEKIAGVENIDSNESPFNESRFDGKSLGHQRLRQLRESATLLQRWSNQALERIPKGKSGPKPDDSLAWLVTQLAYFFERCLRQSLDWSENRFSFEHFAKTVVRIADANVGPGQIEAALRTARGRIHG